MSEAAVTAVPNLSGYSLTFIDSPGVEFVCVTFQTLSSDHDSLSTVHLYLYGSHVRQARFACDPFFPPTQSAKIDATPGSQRMSLVVSFDPGCLIIDFEDFSFHQANQEISKLPA
jgi:hypothetical protein